MSLRGNARALLANHLRSAMLLLEPGPAPYPHRHLFDAPDYGVFEQKPALSETCIARTSMCDAYLLRRRIRHGSTFIGAGKTAEIFRHCRTLHSRGGVARRF